MFVTGSLASLQAVIPIPTHFIRASRAVAAFLLLSGSGARAQLVVTRADAERAAFSAGTRVALARADTAAALARLLTASVLQNPVLTASYSKAVPTKHVTLEIPVLDALWSRAARVGQANAAARASRLLFASERLAAMVEVDTTYTRALAANARFRLSRQTSLDADSLRKMTERRRDAGDASDLDVDLATVVAGQQTNTTANDSLSYMGALLTVQTLMGLPADSVSITLADSLVLTALDSAEARRQFRSTTAVMATPSVMAAEANLQAAEQAITLQRRVAFPLPSLSIGFEQGDDTQPGILPLIGFVVPLPFFNRNQGPDVVYTFTTSAQRVISARMKSPKASADIGPGTAPRSIKRSLMSAVPSALTDSLLSLAMISLGVPFGATSPNQDCTSNPASPASPIVGTSGADGERCALVTASARNLPAFT